MGHFAELDFDNKVIRVVVAETKEWCEQNLGGVWVQTSYNTRGGQHPEGKPLNKNFAGVGHFFDGIGFYAPQPFASWHKNEETYLWEAPIQMPDDGNYYEWNEEVQNWQQIVPFDESQSL
jgi:hypothetical protein